MTDDETTIAAIAALTYDGSLTALRRLQERLGKDEFSARAIDLMTDPATRAERPRFLQVGAFLSEVGPPPPMLVDRLIPEKSLVLLAGKPKQGKSLAGLDVGDAIAANRNVFCEFALSHSGPVCYLGMEDGIYEIANRLLTRGLREDHTDHPLFVCTERLLLNTAGGIAMLTEMFAEIEPKPVLVIVDTAREALGIRDWNDPAEVSDAVRLLRMWARENCSVLLVAHNRKQAGIDAGDEIAGSGAFASSVDGWISVQRSEKLENGNRRLHLQVIGRGNMNGDLVVEMDTHNLFFRRVSDEDLMREQQERQQDARVQKYDRILDALRNRTDGKATVGMIATAIGQEYDTTRLQIQNALKEGVLKDTGERLPAEGRGRPAPLYAVSEELSNLFSFSIGTNKKFDNSPLSKQPAPAPFSDAPEDTDETVL